MQVPLEFSILGIPVASTCFEPHIKLPKKGTLATPSNTDY